MDHLTRYPLSVLLSFLTETEGTSLLITNKRFAKYVLPMYRLPSPDDDGLRVVNAPKRKNRHRFRIVPVQDPTLLLDRLNTKRLYGRIVETRRIESTCDDVEERQSTTPFEQGYSTSELAIRECRTCTESKRQWLIPTRIPCLLRFAKPEKGRGITLLASYPRSGNTLVRTLLEKVTGCVTGSDTRPNRNLSRELAERHNLIGEGVVDGNSTPFVKTHWPERTGCVPFVAKRVILVVRNPYDAIDSYWNMNATCSHTQTVTDEVYEQFADFYNDLARNEIGVWIKFHHYWLQEAAKKIPILVIRFEDLIRDPAEQVRQMLQFSLGAQPLPKDWDERIRSVIQTGPISKLGSYQPRDITTPPQALPSIGNSRLSSSIGKSISKGRYASSLLDELHKLAASHPVNYLQTFGYDMQTQKFPSNYHENTIPSVPKPMMPVSGKPTKVNVGNLVRPASCKFGRNLTYWRHSVTNKDENPLPTVAKSMSANDK